MTVLRSRDNARVKRWIRLGTDGRFRRKEGRALIEGPNLVAAAKAAGVTLLDLLVAEGALSNGEIISLVGGSTPVVLSDSVFGAIVDVETPQGIAAEIEIPRPAAGKGDCVYLEGVQDAGNVGAIIRSAAAFGIRNVFIGKDSADPWSPKVLRAGAGGHFQLGLVAGEPPDGVRLVCTVARGGTSLKDADLAGPLCWVFGSEGKGVSPEVQRRASLKVTIPTGQGIESLNVAAAAAVCLHQAFSRRAGRS